MQSFTRLKRSWKSISGIGFATVVLLSYQNCGKALQPNGALDSSSLAAPFSTPEISLLAPIAPLSSSANFSASFVVKFDYRLKLNALTCQINSQTAVDCSPLTLSLPNLADGDYNLKINAEDSKGQKANELNRLFRIDTTAPTLMVSSTPATVSGSTAAQFVFSAMDNLSGVVSIECALDGAAFTRA